jgi:hypothetical protein
VDDRNDSVPSVAVPFAVLILGIALFLFMQPPAESAVAPISGTAVAMPTSLPPPPPTQPPVVEAGCSEDFINRAMNAVDMNEGSGGFVKINWDDAGAGISVGKFQWNQVYGGLPGLLRRFHDANPQRFNEIFGEHAGAMLDENFVRYRAVFAPGNDLGQRIMAALAEPDFQAVQMQIMRERIEWAIGVSREFNHRSELFIVQVADIANQMGDTGMRNAMNASGAPNIVDEQEAIAAFIAQAPRPGGERRNAQLAAAFSADVLVC